MSNAIQPYIKCVRVTSQCSYIAVDAWYCSLLECALWSSTSVRVTSQCSYIAVDAWYCSLLECALWSNTSDVNKQVLGEQDIA